MRKIQGEKTLYAACIVPCEWTCHQHFAQTIEGDNKSYFAYFLGETFFSDKNRKYYTDSYRHNQVINYNV